MIVLTRTGWPCDVSRWRQVDRGLLSCWIGQENIWRDEFYGLLDIYTRNWRRSSCNVGILWIEKPSEWIWFNLCCWIRNLSWVKRWRICNACNAKIFMTTDLWLMFWEFKLYLRWSRETRGVFFFAFVIGIRSTLTCSIEFWLRTPWILEEVIELRRNLFWMRMSMDQHCFRFHVCYGIHVGSC